MSPRNPASTARGANRGQRSASAAGEVLGEDDAAVRRVLDRRDAWSFAQLALGFVELADRLAGGVAGVDATVLGHGDAAGVDGVDGLDRGGDDLAEDLFQVTDTASKGQLLSGVAECRRRLK